MNSNHIFLVLFILAVTLQLPAAAAEDESIPLPDISTMLGPEKGIARRPVKTAGVRPAARPEIKVERKPEAPKPPAPVQKLPAPVAKLPVPQPKPVPSPPPAPPAAEAAPIKTTTTFTYTDPKAKKVSLAGEFNQWNKDALPMTKMADGLWEAEVELKPGRYEYKFVVDGDWDKGNKDNRTKTVKADRAGPAPTPTYALPIAAEKREPRDPQPAAPASAEPIKAVEEEGVSAGDLTPGAQVFGDGRVRFVYKDPLADQVFVAGSFNNWIPDAWPMMKTGNGLWVVTMQLKPGVYTYKYYIGGVWKVDPANPKMTDGGYGPDSVIEVGAPDPERVKVPTTFTARVSRAKRITLAGDFNGWDPNGIELQNLGGEVWEVTVDLKPGAYEYKFIVDGDWETLNKGSIEVK